MQQKKKLWPNYSKGKRRRHHPRKSLQRICALVALCSHILGFPQLTPLHREPEVDVSQWAAVENAAPTETAVATKKNVHIGELG
jgi:hypothetical protein